MPNPVTYAEDTLGVHEILEAATKARDDVSQIYSELVDMKQDKVQVEHDLEMLELEIAQDEYVKHPSMSATAMKDHLKGAYFKNEKWRELKARITELTKAIIEEEMDKRLTEKDLDIANSRMIELGGYLMFLGACKIAGSASGQAA